MGWDRQLGAFIVGFSLLVASCSGSSIDSTAKTTSQPTATSGEAEPALTMDEAVGGTQAVQDFVVLVDMWKGTEDGPESFYGDVLAQAGTEVGELDEIGRGFTWAPVDSIEGSVTDENGEDLPSVSLDLGLVGLTPDALATATGSLAGVLEDAGADEVAEAVASAGDDEGALLVEVATADYTEARTHVAPGDLATIDLSFVETLAPGDDLAISYVFGQTIPGDPDDEEGLSPHELFTDRWERGLVRVLGDEGGAALVTDPAATAVEGSTLLTHDMKQQLLDVAREEGLRGGFEEAENLVDELGDTERGERIPVDWDQDREPDFYVERKDDAHISVQDETENALAPMPPIAFALWYAMTKSATQCATTAALLNAANADQGVPVGGSLLGIRPSDYLDLDGGDLDDAALRGDEPPGPVSCGPSDRPPPLPPTGFVGGDPHLGTVDGLDYDNQAAGEFVLFQNDTATVQVRTEPWRDADSVSMATAVAIGVGEHTVSLHAGGEAWIDGQPADLERGETVKIGDAELLWSIEGWVVVWPDGTVARLRDRDDRLHITLTPSEHPARGLFGDNDGDSSNDFVTRDGEQLDEDADDDFEDFYATYIDSWRISQNESLFHYEDDESTETFTLEGFPAQPIQIGSVDADAADDAERRCQATGVTREDALEDCVVDVVVTGDPSFAYDALLTQLATPDPDEEPDEDGAGEAEPSPASEDNTLTIGEVTIAFGPSPPVQVANTTVEWVCEARDGYFTATSSFDETPTTRYELQIQYEDEAESADGEERLTVIVDRNLEDFGFLMTAAEPFADAVDEVSLEGSTLTASGELRVTGPGGEEERRPFRLRSTCDR